MSAKRVVVAVGGGFEEGFAIRGSCRQLPVGSQLVPVPAFYW